MELLIADLDDTAKKRFQNEDGSFNDACAWRGVTCSEAGEVVELTFYYSIGHGTLALNLIPHTVRNCRLCNSHTPGCKDERKMFGTLDTATLPPVLLSINLSYNLYSSTLDLTCLPVELKSFDVRNNRFTGSCNLESLPATLRSLELANNRFSGSVCLTKLPVTLTTLWLRNNAFSGELCFANFPPKMIRCFLEENQFSGEFHFPHVRNENFMLYASENNFEGTAVIPAATREVRLQNTGVVAVVDIDGSPNPQQPAILGKLDPSHNAERNIGDLQLLAMIRFADPTILAPKDVQENYNRILNINFLLQYGAKTYNDCCAWRGVGCADGVIVSIHLDHSGRGGGKITAIHMSWMPPTVRYAWIGYLHTFHGWKTSRLPREMRYLSLTHVDRVPILKGRELEVDLRMLPSQMEELYVVGGWYNGAVYVDNLPQSMRIIQITNPAVNEAFVNFAALPLGFQGMCLSNTLSDAAQKKTEMPRIRGTGRIRSDRRVVNSRARFEHIESKYASMFGK